MKDITSNNRLIAEFMVLPTKVFKSGILNYYHFGMDCDNNWYEAHELSYNLSWEWLMPVVRRIVTICCNENDEAFESDEYTSILDVTPLAIKTETYRAVVEFINYYNKIK